MDFILTNLWSVLCFIGPGVLLGMGFALRRQPVQAAPGPRGEAWDYTVRVFPEVALRVGWGLMGASLLAHGMGSLLAVPPGRVLGVCLVMDTAALAACIGIMEGLLRERFRDRA